jgi:hypothetical protein
MNSAAARWRKSSHSGANGCVEVADGGEGGSVHVRDSTNPTGPALTFTAATWRAFIDAVKGAGP